MGSLGDFGEIKNSNEPLSARRNPFSSPHNPRSNKEQHLRIVWSKVKGETWLPFPCDFPITTNRSVETSVEFSLSTRQWRKYGKNTTHSLLKIKRLVIWNLVNRFDATSCVHNHRCPSCYLDGWVGGIPNNTTVVVSPVWVLLLRSTDRQTFNFDNVPSNIETNSIRDEGLISAF